MHVIPITKPGRVLWKCADGQVREIAVCRDPGPGTYQETADGMRELFRVATLKLRTAAERLHDAPPGDIDGVSPEQGAHSAALAEWRSARDNLASREAFIRVHPELAHAPITVACGHPRVVVEGLWSLACVVSGKQGWYRDVETRVVLSIEREPGADDDDGQELPAPGAWYP